MSPVRSRATTRIGPALVGAVVAGVALGFGTQILQGWVPGESATLANSGVVWALVAFALGLLVPSARAAAVGGSIDLSAASLSYYVAAAWLEHVGFASRGAVVWPIRVGDLR